MTVRYSLTKRQKMMTSTMKISKKTSLKKLIQFPTTAQSIKGESLLLRVTRKARM